MHDKPYRRFREGILMDSFALVGIAALPFLAFTVGSGIIRLLTGRQEVLDRLKYLPTGEQSHLNERIQGYKVPAVQRVWEALKADPPVLNREHAALLLDLIFPVLYGAAFAASLLAAWRLLDRPFNVIWLLLPAVIYLLADWTENTVHLRYLRRYRQVGLEALQPGWVQVASRATTTKLIFFLGSQFLIWVLIIVHLWNQ
jgi:hypothetical protein